MGRVGNTYKMSRAGKWAEFVSGPSSGKLEKVSLAVDSTKFLYRDSNTN